jgi:hypothetical protein
MNNRNLIIVALGLTTLIILALVNEFFKRTLLIPSDYYVIVYCIFLILVNYFLYRYAKKNGKDKIFFKWILGFSLSAILIYFLLKLFLLKPF